MTGQTQLVDVFQQPIPLNKRPMVPVRRVQKAPDHLDPLSQGKSFVLHGHVYIVKEDMSRGRHKIKHLGIVSQG
jgi:hypothetical protein